MSPGVELVNSGLDICPGDLGLELAMVFVEEEVEVREVFEPLGTAICYYARMTPQSFMTPEKQGRLMCSTPL